MKNHSEYLNKKKDFIRENSSLSENFFTFYTGLFELQQKAYDALGELSLSFESCGKDNLPFLKIEHLKLDSKILDVLNILALDISSEIKKTNPGMDFSAFESSFVTDATDLLKSLLAKDYSYFELKEKAYKLDISEILFMVHNIFKPLMIKAAENANLKIEKEDWLRGDCPFCGYLPDFSKIVESVDNKRKLHCSLCESEWEFPRLQCHVCGNDNQETLGYYEYEGTDYRIYYCEHCKSYIKALKIPKLKEESNIDLAVEDIVTGFLDSSMMQKGYVRC